MRVVKILNKYFFSNNLICRYSAAACLLQRTDIIKKTIKFKIKQSTFEVLRPLCRLQSRTGIR